MTRQQETRSEATRGAILRRVPIPPKDPRRGGALIYWAFLGPVLLIMCLVGLDWGRVQLTQSELRRACDAAARYAVTGASDNTSLAKAQFVASQNPGSQTIQFNASNVVVGTWDTTTKTFTPGGARSNAVRVSASTTVAPVFAQALGLSTKTVSTFATAQLKVAGYGVVGLNSIYMSGNASTSYWAGSGSGWSGYGSIASNGYVTLNGNSYINGDVYYGNGRSSTGGTVTGSRTTLSSPLVYPNGSASPYSPTNNDNSNVPTWAMAASSLKIGSNKSLSLPGGNYFFNNVTLDGGGDLSFTGPTTLYCYGAFTMGGRTNTSGSTPGNLKIVMVPNPYNGSAPGDVNISSTANLYASVYAPQSNVVLSGSGDIFGTVLGLTVSMTGTSGIHYDVSLDANNGGISLVE